METILLKKSPLFSGLSDSEISALCRDFGCYSRCYDARSTIWLRGDSVSAAGVVLRGCVQAERITKNGDYQIVARHRAGALFGDLLMSSQNVTSPFDIIALTGAEVLFLPLENMMREGAARNAAAVTRFRLNLLGELSDKYWAQQRRIESLCIRSLRGRIAFWLLGEAMSEEGAVLLPPTRELWAAQLGVNRSALSRELSRMQAEGILQLERRSLRLLDISALQELVE